MRGKLDRVRGVSLSGIDDDPRVAEIMNRLLRARLAAHQMLAEEPFGHQPQHEPAALAAVAPGARS